MPRQNRVQPDGEILAHPARGLFMGNRGILHDDAGRLTHRRWRHRAWVTCVLAFKGRRRHPLMQPGRYTELFFHDEAVAFAAGHRPCGECRRADYLRFRDAAGIVGPVADFDRKLHAARALARRFAQNRHVADIADLPDGTFILGEDGMARLVLGETLRGFRPDGYLDPEPRPRSGPVTTLTPKPILQAFRNGYKPFLRLPT